MYIYIYVYTYIYKYIILYIYIYMFMYIFIYLYRHTAVLHTERLRRDQIVEPCPGVVSRESATQADYGT